jgi:hypothetical protein
MVHRYTADPDAARFITEDLPRFWTAFDAPGEDRAEVYARLYLAPGSAGLQDFLKLRIDSAEALADTIKQHPRFYASLQQVMAKVPKLLPRIRRSYRRLKAILPEVIFPDTYFLIGRLTSGGTASTTGLLIGTEMFGRTADTPTDELNPWLQSVLQPPEVLPHLVAHELVHFLQVWFAKEPLEGEQPNLLTAAVIEGMADFVGELISGGHINTHLHVYGLQHERVLWHEFQQVMHGHDYQGWLYEGRYAWGRPADLGYFIGYRIVQRYYQRHRDKRQALREILSITDVDAFVEASGY